MGKIITRRAAIPALVSDPMSMFAVGSVRTYLEALEQFERTSEDLLFFRGHERHTYLLQPSIYRKIEWIENEDILCKEMLLRCPEDFYRMESTFQALVKMQHYSLPTRLLDLTANPLMALYFACGESTGPVESGEVIVLRVSKQKVKYFDSDTVSVIANLSRCSSSFILPPGLVDPERLNAHDDLRRLLREIKKEKPYFEPLIRRRHLESVVCVKPRLDNPRVIRQDGAFLLFGINGKKSRSAEVPAEMIASVNEQRIIVKARDKSKILQQLDALGVNQGSVFPEVQQVAEFIKALHGPRQ